MRRRSGLDGHTAATPQTSLFGDEPAAPGGGTARAGVRVGVRAATPDAGLAALAGRLAARHGDRLHLGTSSWHFPGWSGLVWDRPHDPAALSRDGLAAYAAHPLMRTVSLDRAFYRPPDAATYRRLAALTPPGFRFVVKAAAAVTDAVLRDPASGRMLQANPDFLDTGTALARCVQPCVEGLAGRLGVLVFQISPLPPRWLADAGAWRIRLGALLDVVVPALPAGAIAAVEVRDPGLLGPELAALLRDRGARYVLGLHDRMPAADAQLPMLRATWPGDLICRWNLQRGQRYADVRDRWAPFDRLQAPDADTRSTLARVMHATLAAGHRVFVTINNKAEGSAPRSVRALAEALDALDTPAAPGASAP
ncbi:MAG: DUF72 domain-containing protein [Rubrivivax sp.]|jgi:uncharacterized protein YecE (DUF72 family)|nr:DUF72 domain-containing protein [Rubrivivax sp.]